MRIPLKRGVGLGRAAALATIASVVGCSAFGSEPGPTLQPPPTENDAGAEDARADASGEGDGAGGVDSALDGAAECPGTLVHRDDFEGASWTNSAWDSAFSSGQGSYTIDPRHQVGVTSLRFATKFHTDVASLSKTLGGRCPITVRTWLYIGATSVTDGTSLIRINLTNGKIVAVHLIEGAWIAASGVSPGLGAVPRQTWTEIVLKYDPKTGAASLTAGTLARAFTVEASEPVSIELGILGASDGGIDGDEILFDDVRIAR